MGHLRSIINTGGVEEGRKLLQKLDPGMQEPAFP